MLNAANPKAVIGEAIFHSWPTAEPAISLPTSFNVRVYERGWCWTHENHSYQTSSVEGHHPTLSLDHRAVTPKVFCFVERVIRGFYKIAK